MGHFITATTPFLKWFAIAATLVAAAGLLGSLLLQATAARPLESTMFSILAFYIVSAAYRAFRVRSAEAAILMITAVVLMLGQVPVGALLTSKLPEHGAWSGLRIENISQWVLTAINAPVQR